MAKKKKVKLCRLEKMLIKLCTVVLLLFPVTVVLSKAALSNMNLEVEKLKRNINVQKNSNESLTMKVNELVSLENMQSVAQEEGLEYNNKNVVVIQK